MFLGGGVTLSREVYQLLIFWRRLLNFCTYTCLYISETALPFQLLQNIWNFPISSCHQIQTKYVPLFWHSLTLGGRSWWSNSRWQLHISDLYQRISILGAKLRPYIQVLCFYFNKLDDSTLMHKPTSKYLRFCLYFGLLHKIHIPRVFRLKALFTLQEI